MTNLERLKKVRESIIYETAWLIVTMPKPLGPKDKVIDTVTCIWNCSVPRAGFRAYINELCISEKDIRDAAKLWNSKTGILSKPKESQTDKK